MSKLEKALQKAISARNTNKTALVENNASGTVTAEQETVTNGRISSMREISLLEKTELEKRKIIFPDMSNGKVVDQFREVRTHIYHALHNNNSPILVTAVSSGAGNSFVTKNIAAAIALDDARTSLVVDCDLTGTDSSQVSDDADYLGITDYIERDLPLEDIIAPTGITRMRFISAGARKESVTDYLTSPRLKSLFTELQNKYSDRVILVDTPSINDSADAKILAGLFSHVILVVPYRGVTKGNVEKAINAIGKEKIIGIVINREPRFLSLFKYSR